MSNYICNSHKHTLGGQTTKTITLPMEITGLPETLEIEGVTLLRKKKFHVSLVCIGRLMVKNGITDTGLVKNIVDDFCEFY